MCEIIFFVRDKFNPEDVYADVKCYKRGHVIMVKPAGWPWTELELTNPDWRILKLPNVTEAQAASLVAHEIPTDPQKPGKMLQRRGFKFDLDDVNLPNPIKSWLADDTRAQQFRSSNFTAAQFLAFRKPMPLRVDPNVL